MRNTSWFSKKGEPVLVVVVLDSDADEVDGVDEVESESELGVSVALDKVFVRIFEALDSKLATEAEVKGLAALFVLLALEDLSLLHGG